MTDKAIERLGYAIMMLIAVLLLSGCEWPTLFETVRNTNIECNPIYNFETGEITYYPEFTINETGTTMAEALKYCQDIYGGTSDGK
jgi:hypothetical protein